MAADQEIEIKLYVLDLSRVESRLLALGAELAQPRTHELNLRFDRPDGALTRQGQLVRLRQDKIARLTYKGPPSGLEGVRVRQEIEFTVGDFQAARRFLEALGFGVSMIYEKYRREYHLEGLHIALDELPYGDFVEIEGPDSASIRLACARLELDFSAGIPESYTMLFERWRQRTQHTQRDLVFANFQALKVTPEELGVRPADQPA